MGEHSCREKEKLAICLSSVFGSFRLNLMLQGTEGMVPEEVGARAAHSLLEEISRGGVCDSTHQVCAWRCSTPDAACMLSVSCSRGMEVLLDDAAAQHSRPLGALLLLPSVCLSLLPQALYLEPARPSLHSLYEHACWWADVLLPCTAGPTAAYVCAWAWRNK